MWFYPQKFTFKALSSLHMTLLPTQLGAPTPSSGGSMPSKGWLSTDTRLLFADCYRWIRLPATMDCRQVATLAAGNRKKIQMEQLPKENYYGHFGNFASTQKARLSSSSSGSGVVCYHGGAVMTWCR